MRKYKIRILVSIILIVFSISLIPNNSYAGMQANKGGTSKVSTTASDFFTLIRAMEGTLGVVPDDTTNNKYNGIDAHMAKNTEWGTAAMLAVSSYGAGNATNAASVTTGNSSGIYSMGDNMFEYTANYITGNTKDFAANITNAESKYKNEYTSISARINGDALNLGSITLGNQWDANGPVIVRGRGALFTNAGYGNGYGIGASNLPGGGGTARSNNTSRACVVMGSGL